MIEQIWINPEIGIPNKRVTEIQVVAGSGIVGDHNFNKSQWIGQNITFIEREKILQYNKDYGQNIEMGATRRNIVTKGIDLNALVDKEFSIGDVRFKGVDLCEPCKDLGQALATDTITSPEVVKAFLTWGGLRANILQDGQLSVGMSFEVQL